MQCPFCKAEDTRVIDSRAAEEGLVVRRRRECEKCATRFTTFERAQLQLPQIKKREGAFEAFDEEKLRKGLERALHKRPVTPENIDHVVERMIKKLRSSPKRHVDTRELGQWVMLELRDLDHVAYVRFASIYHQFQDVHAFREEIERLAAFPSAEERRSQLPLINPEPPKNDKD